MSLTAYGMYVYVHMLGITLEYTQEYKRTGELDMLLPRLTVCIRSDPSSPWTPVEHIYPLLVSVDGREGGRDGGKKQGVLKCRMKLTIDPSTGILIPDLKQGDSINEIKIKRNFWLQIISAILLLFSIPLCIYGYSKYTQYSTVWSHEAWLRDFYKIHAPEKVRIMMICMCICVCLDLSL